MKKNFKGFIDKYKQKLQYLKKRDVKFLCFAIIIILIGIFVFCKRDDIYYFYQSAGRVQYPENLILVPNITGYNEEDAIERLLEEGFTNIERAYTVDKFTKDGAVIKTNYDINAALNPEDRIVVYICKTEVTQTDSVNVNKEYYSMDHINIVDMTIKGDKFYAIIKNKNNAAIRDITYKIGFQNENKKFIGEKQYKMDGITILPNEKYLITGEIEQLDATYITFSGFNYTTVEVPEEERSK